jgi:hypothetical protein
MSLELVRLGERRGEPRTGADFSVQVWGIDIRGEHFLQEARVREISLSGGLLSHLETDLRSGDVIGVLYAGKKARYKVIWVRYCGSARKIQAAIQLMDSDECPWTELLANGARATSAGRP